MKKKCAYFLVAALSVSMLAGCGSKSKGSDNSTKKEAKSEKVSVGLSDVLANIAEAATGIESVKLEANGEAEVVISMSGQEMTATGSINLASNAVKADPAFDVKGTAEYNLDMGGQNISGDYSVEAYAEEEDDKMTVYAQTNDTGWEKSSMEKSEFDEAFEQIESAIESMAKSFSELSEDDLKQVEEYVKLEDKTKSVNGKQCYVLTVDVDRDQIIELAEMGQELTDEYTDEEFTEYLDTFKKFDKFDITVSLYFDKDTYLPVKVSMDIAMDGEVQGYTISVKKLSLEVVLGVNDDVSVSPVPEDAKENAVEAEDYDTEDVETEDVDVEE